MNKNNIFGERLRKLMAYKGMRLKDVSKQTGKAVSTVSTWVNGQIPSDAIVQEHLAELLGVDRRYLIYGEGESLIFSNENIEHRKGSLLEEIDVFYNNILTRAKNHKGGLEHFLIELKRHFPSDLYR